MFWVILVVGVLIYLFFSAKSEEKEKLNRQGGFYFKYKYLIDYYADEHGVVIEKKDKTSITVAMKDSRAITRYTISHGFEEVHIFFHQQSLNFGEHSLKWNFPESMSQEHMIDIINQEVHLYFKNLME